MPAIYGIRIRDASGDLPEVDTLLRRLAEIGEIRYVSAPPQTMYKGSDQLLDPLFRQKGSIDDEFDPGRGLMPPSMRRHPYDLLGPIVYS